MNLFVLLCVLSVSCKLADAACAPGNYIDPADNVCKACAIGTYNAATDSSSCTACATPTTTANAGSTASTDCYCPPGYFIDPADNVCKPCGVGSYSAGKDATGCTACTSPMTTTSAGSTDVSACMCGPGNHVDSADNTCKPCAVGSYNEENRASSCTACPSAMTTAKTGSKAYKDCACKPGYQTQGTWCEMCQIGFYTVTGKEATCTACPTGYTTSNPGSTAATDCSVCHPGYYRETTTNTCKICAKGSYSNTAGATSCTTCPSGQTTSGTGSSEAWSCHRQCPAGQYYSYYGTFGECSLCPVGAYAPPGSDAACTQCPAGYTTVAMGSSSASSCSECQYGYIQNGDKCEPCPVGQYYTTYYDGTRSFRGKCAACPAGKTTKAPGAKEFTECVCSPGTYVQASTWFERTCLSCPVGSYSDAVGAQSCTNCPMWRTTTAVSQTAASSCVCEAGTFLHATDNVCVKCRVGSYSTTGAATCTACPTGSTTLEDGSTSVEACVCQTGYFLNPATMSCQICPSNSYTDKTGQTICTDCPTGKTNSADHTSCV